jgi:hypothetical protein
VTRGGQPSGHRLRVPCLPDGKIIYSRIMTLRQANSHLSFASFLLAGLLLRPRGA